MKAVWFLTALSLVCVFATIVRTVIAVRYLRTHPEVMLTFTPKTLRAAIREGNRVAVAAETTQDVSFYALLLFGLMFAVALFVRWMLR